MIISDVVSSGQSADEQVHVLVKIHAGMSGIRLGQLKCARLSIGHFLYHQAANVTDPVTTHCTLFSNKAADHLARE